MFRADFGPPELFAKEFLEQQRRVLGEHAYNREYLGIPGGERAVRLPGSYTTARRTGITLAFGRSVTVGVPCDRGSTLEVFETPAASSSMTCNRPLRISGARCKSFDRCSRDSVNLWRARELIAFPDEFFQELI
jgi:hypothetical protein